MGHDILSELIYGSRVSLIVGLGAALMATLIGTVMGLLAGYFKGTTDEILMGITDIFLMIPQIPLIIVLAAFLRPSFWLVALLMGSLWWTSMARVVRSKALQVREMGFVQASRALGFRDRHIIITDVLPNIFHVIMSKFLLSIASAMIAEASISFLGLGDPTMKSWGMMINFAFTRGGFINGYWWWYLTPGLCITFFVLSVVLIRSLMMAEDMLCRLGLGEGQHARMYPFQFSGGMNQRVMIATSMILSPKIIIADEPSKGLDGALVGEVMAEMARIKDQMGASLLLITHDLLLARDVSDRMAVMYCGEIVEIGKSQEIFSKPLHPYTIALLSCLPERGFQPIPGSSPSMIEPPIGCKFHPRCPQGQEMCRRRPEMVQVGEREEGTGIGYGIDREVRCWLY